MNHQLTPDMNFNLQSHTIKPEDDQFSDRDLQEEEDSPLLPLDSAPITRKPKPRLSSSNGVNNNKHGGHPASVTDGARGLGRREELNDWQNSRYTAEEQGSEGDDGKIIHH